MRRGPLLWWALFAALAVIVAIGVVAGSGRSGQVAGGAIPTVVPGSDVLAGVSVVESRIRGEDYRRAAFGDAWDDDNNAPGGRNGCDTRNDILNRDLDDKTYVSTKRCPQAVAGGTLRDPYTNATVAFVRGNRVGASVQIDHLVPLALGKSQEEPTEEPELRDDNKQRMEERWQAIERVEGKEKLREQIGDIVFDSKQSLLREGSLHGEHYYSSKNQYMDFPAELIREFDVKEANKDELRYVKKHHGKEIIR